MIHDSSSTNELIAAINAADRSGPYHPAARGRPAAYLISRWKLTIFRDTGGWEKKHGGDCVQTLMRTWGQRRQHKQQGFINKRLDRF